MKKFTCFTLAAILMLLVCTTAFADKTKLYTTTSYASESIDLQLPNGTHRFKSLQVAGAKTVSQVVFNNAGTPKSVDRYSYSGVKTSFTHGTPAFTSVPVVGGLTYQSAQLWSVSVSVSQLIYEYYNKGFADLGENNQILNPEPNTFDYAYGYKNNLNTSFYVTPY